MSYWTEDGVARDLGGSLFTVDSFDSPTDWNEPTTELKLDTLYYGLKFYAARYWKDGKGHIGRFTVRSVEDAEPAVQRVCNGLGVPVQYTHTSLPGRRSEGHGTPDWVWVTPTNGK